MLFAALHFGVAAISRALEIYDDIILTILTITMVIIISMRNNSRVELIAIMTLVVTLLGYVIGSWFQQPLTSIINNGIYAPAISTFIVTATLGLMTDYVTNKAIRLKNRERNFSFSSLKITNLFDFTNLREYFVDIIITADGEEIKPEKWDTSLRTVNA